MKRSFSFFDIGNVLIAPIGRSSVFEQQRRGNGLFPRFYSFSEGFGQPILEQFGCSRFSTGEPDLEPLPVGADAEMSGEHFERPDARL